MTTDTPEYKAIDSCRRDLTEMLSNYFKDVTERLRDSETLTANVMKSLNPEILKSVLIGS